MLGLAAKPSGDQQRANLVAVQPGAIALVIQPRLPGSAPPGTVFSSFFSTDYL